MKQIRYIFILVILQFACKKEKSSIPENESWKPVSEIQNGNKNASYCYSNGKLLFLRSLTSFSRIDSNHLLLDNWILNSNLNYLYRVFPMSMDFFLSISSGSNPIGIRFHSILDPHDYGDFHLEKDTDIISLDDRFINFWAPAYIESASGHFVFKVIDKTNLKGSTLVILDLKNPFSLKKVKLPFPTNYLALHFYNSGKFYFSNTSIGELYSLDSIGQFEKIADKGFSFISMVNGNMLAIGPFWNLSLSPDNGLTWLESNFKLPASNLINLEGKAIFFINSSLSELRIEGKNISVVDYNSKGLEGNEITWICRHRDRYYCTTKSGVFYIEDKYFLPK